MISRRTRHSAVAALAGCAPFQSSWTFNSLPSLAFRRQGFGMQGVFFKECAIIGCSASKLAHAQEFCFTELGSVSAPSPKLRRAVTHHLRKPVPSSGMPAVQRVITQQLQNCSPWRVGSHRNHLASRFPGPIPREPALMGWVVKPAKCTNFNTTSYAH